MRCVRCYYCGCHLSRKNNTIDHMRPLSRGGSDHPRNKVRCCRPCNQHKGCLTAEEWRLVLALRRGVIDKARMRFYGEQSNY